MSDGVKSTRWSRAAKLVSAGVCLAVAGAVGAPVARAENPVACAYSMKLSVLTGPQSAGVEIAIIGEDGCAAVTVLKRGAAEDANG